jgi:DNA-binding IclR family transcriptional regulator
LLLGAFVDQNASFRLTPADDLGKGRDNLLKSICGHIGSRLELTELFVVGGDFDTAVITRWNNYDANGNRTPMGSFFRVRNGLIVEWMDTAAVGASTPRSAGVNSSLPDGERRSRAAACCYGASQVTSPARVFAVLDLFTSERPVWHADEISRALSYSRATGYRYVRDLIEAGFLQKVSAGYYALGPRIILLDYQLRQSDPVLQAAVPIMESLASRTGLDVVLSAIFGTQVVDTYRSNRGTSLQLAYGRGRPRPLFRGAAPKVLVAHLSRATLLRLHKSHAREIAAEHLGNSWASFAAPWQRCALLSMCRLAKWSGTLAPRPSRCSTRTVMWLRRSRWSARHSRSGGWARPSSGNG